MYHQQIQNNDVKVGLRVTFLYHVMLARQAHGCIVLF